ncbi:hypothetical protein LRAMOSA01755 [Lichtheimia ramosa]|uniref:Integrator complex subunit 2 n=1 Tax=Lichtheimia ramosa TaxID=688394 RepID=A0A077WJ43_9FUNG|nr:hypothetical protein LRAMOSA01755 [Lichtheimia ramosa]
MSGKDSFSLESFHQLLRGRVFYGNIDYGVWLMQCITTATLPINPMFAVTIKEYVQSVFHVDRIQPIAEDKLVPFFDNLDNITPAQVLVAFYVLQFHDAIIAFKTDPKLATAVHVQYQEYSFIDRIPIRSMLNHLEKGSAYRGIYRDFLAMAANLYPELFDVSGLLFQEGKEDLTVMDRVWNGGYPSLEKLDSILSKWQQYPDQAACALTNVSSMESVKAIPYAEICFSRLLRPSLNEEDMPSVVVEALLSTWESLHRVIPYELWVITANALRSSKMKEEYTLELIIKAPLSLLKCDPLVFRSERLLSLWLHMMGCVRVCSRHRIWKKYYTIGSTKLNTRNINALTNAQDSAMIQALLEHCKETEADKGKAGSLRKAQQQICQFIHSIFIDDSPLLIAKLLHFQTYSIELIPTVVEMIPSLYAVFNFIPELIRQPQPEKQVFAILLACHLCEKYPLETYLQIAEKHVLPRLLKIAFPPPSTTCVPSEFLVQAIPGFVHLAKAFPHFSPQILQAFEQISNGLPAPAEFVGQEENSKIILILRLHQVLSDSKELVQYQCKE